MKMSLNTAFHENWPCNQEMPILLETLIVPAAIFKLFIEHQPE
jgi:hypothetical protein